MDTQKKLYKYESFNTYSLANLKNQQLYFSSPITFNDPFDCAIGCTLEDISQSNFAKIYDYYLAKDPSKFSKPVQLAVKEGLETHIEKELLKLFTDMLKKSFIDSRNNILNNRGISCFSETSDEILMWSHYANKHQGFCLEFDTDFDPFNRAIKISYSYQIPHINPAELILNSDSNQFLKMVTNKYKVWEYEKEWRVLHDEGNTSYGYPARSLTGIYFGPKINYAHLEIIALIVQGQNPDVKFYQGSISEDKYKLNFKEISYIPYVQAKKHGMV